MTGFSLMLSPPSLHGLAAGSFPTLWRRMAPVAACRLARLDASKKLGSQAYAEMAH
jgi:hypothetical protein